MKMSLLVAMFLVLFSTQVGCKAPSQDSSEKGSNRRQAAGKTPEKKSIALSAQAIRLQQDFDGLTAKIKIAGSDTIQAFLKIQIDWITRFEKNGDVKSKDTAILVLERIQKNLIRSVKIEPKNAVLVEGYKAQVQLLLNALK